MKSILLIMSLFFSVSVQAELGEKFCMMKAEGYFEGYHDRVMEEIGVVQGLAEEISVTYSQRINEIDQRDETYVFEVAGANDGGAGWVRRYTVEIEAWLIAGGDAHICTLTQFTNHGVVEQFGPGFNSDLVGRVQTPLSDIFERSEGQGETEFDPY